MPVYRVQRDYVGVIEGTRYGLEAGALVALDPGAAALINAERPDTLARIEDGSARSLDEPPANRQITRASRRSKGNAA